MFYRLAGWWGQTIETRFSMSVREYITISMGENDSTKSLNTLSVYDAAFQPTPGAKGFQVSNPSALSMAAMLGSLEVFSQTNMSDLCQKSQLLTGYLEFLLDENLHGVGYKIITPRNPHERGAQFSLLFDELKTDKIVSALLIRGIICDERKPNVIRVTPAPLYNGFFEVYRFAEALKLVLSEM
jgi:kynureninase